jgi:hypothetical protein
MSDWNPVIDLLAALRRRTAIALVPCRSACSNGEPGEVRRSTIASSDASKTALSRFFVLIRYTALWPPSETTGTPATGDCDNESAASELVDDVVA